MKLILCSWHRTRSYNYAASNADVLGILRCKIQIRTGEYIHAFETRNSHWDPDHASLVKTCQKFQRTPVTNSRVTFLGANIFYCSRPLIPLLGRLRHKILRLRMVHDNR